MPIKYILDTREKHLQEHFTAGKVPFETRQLDLGDVLILYSKGEIQEGLSEEARKLLGMGDEKAEVFTVVFERKSYTDLKASMSDGRYREQKARYLKLPKGMMYYLLEANDPQFKSLDKKQFLGMYVHTMVRDGLPVFHTSSLEDTFAFLVKIGQTIEEFGIKGLECPVETTQIKKKKVEGKEVYKQQLCCFPGISSVKADAILAVYPNMASLIEAVKAGNFKVKGLGPVLGKKIKEGLFFE